VLKAFGSPVVPWLRLPAFVLVYLVSWVLNVCRWQASKSELPVIFLGGEGLLWTMIFLSTKTHGQPLRVKHWHHQHKMSKLLEIDFSKLLYWYELVLPEEVIFMALTINLETKQTATFVNLVNIVAQYAPPFLMHLPTREWFRSLFFQK